MKSIKEIYLVTDFKIDTDHETTGDMVSDDIVDCLRDSSTCIYDDRELAVDKANSNSNAFIYHICIEKRD